MSENGRIYVTSAGIFAYIFWVVGRVDCVSVVVGGIVWLKHDVDAPD
jgi:hypothetical protein